MSKQGGAQKLDGHCHVHEQFADQRTQKTPNRAKLSLSFAAGCACLAAHFDDAALRTLSTKIDPDVESPLDYYPLLRQGERFPVSDPELQPRLSPRPASDADFLHGMLEGMARIEAMAYAKLEQLGTIHVHTRTYK